MTAIISTTNDDQYLFYLPITVWAWHKLGVNVVCFYPRTGKDMTPKEQLVASSLPKYGENGLWHLMLGFECPEDKVATYAQCARLFGGCLGADDDEILITSDVDMLVFSTDLLRTDHNIHIWGQDLVPEHQFPVCYASMSKANWRTVMNCGDRTYQQMLDLHLGHIEAQHFRGNYWSKDQELLYEGVSKYPYVPHDRAFPGTQFAKRRIDRDDGMWETMLNFYMIDYHMHRPGYDPDNFSKIMRVLHYYYPDENFKWLIDYYTKYNSLL